MVEVIDICKPYYVGTSSSNDTTDATSIISTINNILCEHNSTKRVSDGVLTAMNDAMKGYLHGELQHDYAEWSSSGSSNGRVLTLAMMFIPNNLSFQLHAHPNIECILVLDGAIYELRLKAKYIFKRDYSADDHDGPDIGSICGICNDYFDLRVTTADNYIINEKGSIHKSFTKDHDTILLVLWGGRHNNIKQECIPLEVDILHNKNNKDNDNG